MSAESMIQIAILAVAFVVGGGILQVLVMYLFNHFVVGHRDERERWTDGRGS